MSKFSRTTFVFFLLAALLVVAQSAAVDEWPVVQAYARFQQDGDSQTILGFVWLTQHTTGCMTVTGQFNTGFTDPDPKNYTFKINGVSIMTNYFTFTINGIGGTEPWTNDICYLKLSGPESVIGKPFDVELNGKNIGSANIKNA